MTKDKIDWQIKGHLRIFKLERRNKTLIREIDNALDPANSKLIVTKLLGGTGNWLNQITCKKASVDLSTKPTTPTYPSVTSIKLTARFNEGDFNDTLDELVLGNDVLGIFSSVTGLAILKTNLYKLEVQWLLTINTL